MAESFFDKLFGPGLLAGSSFGPISGPLIVPEAAPSMSLDEALAIVVHLALSNITGDPELRLIDRSRQYEACEIVLEFKRKGK